MTARLVCGTYVFKEPVNYNEISEGKVLKTSSYGSNGRRVPVNGTWDLVDLLADKKVIVTRRSYAKWVIRHASRFQDTHVRSARRYAGIWCRL